MREVIYEYHPCGDTTAAERIECFYCYIICSDCTRMTKKYKKSFKYASDNLAIIEWNGGVKK